MPEKSDLLRRTKPLADPLRVLTNLLVVTAIVDGVLRLVTNDIWSGLIVACLLLSLALLIAPDGETNAINLRAFRTDKSTATLRAEIAAILGPRFRLSGIRPPREKTSMFLRFLLPGVMAFRYAGSKFMDLEAGDDWMARLWKTYQTTRLVLIDVRDVTVYVQQEIEMTLLTLGDSRCVFIVADGQTAAHQRQLLAQIVGPDVDPAQLRLLEVSPDRGTSRRMESDLKKIVEGIPARGPGELDQGRQFVLDHVSEEVLKKSGRPSVMTLVSVVAALALPVGFGLTRSYLELPDSVLALVLVVVLGFTGLVLTSGMYRAAVRARRLKRAGHGQAAMRAWFLLSLAILLFLAVPVCSAVQFIEQIVPLRNAANESAAIGALRTVNTAEVTYNYMYPDIGYACALRALGGKPDSAARTPEAAQLIQDNLSSGKFAGYTFTISNCTKTMVNGQNIYTGYQVTAIPDSAVRFGERGFCSDENGVIRSDPSGGSNCTEPVQ